MSNPWEEIALSDYENHMSLESVKQLQAMNSIMKKQFGDYPVRTATVLGMIGKLLGGESWTMKSYVEMAYPDQIQTDTRSAEEIKEDIIKRLTGNDSI